MGRVLAVVFDGVQTLDLAGPTDVFAAAANELGKQAYRIELVSNGGGARRTASGLELATRDLAEVRAGAEDMVLVPGANEGPILAAMGDESLAGWLRRANAVVARMASVCSGAFILANAGLLEGKRATTHWLGCAELARRFPDVRVDPNAIFVSDGSLWTSAGVTTGIDMALAIVEEDHGRKLADTIAAALVLYIRRLGFQSQFSPALVAQQSSSDPLGPAVAWARQNLARADVESLARSASLSVRTLHRRCLEQLGTTPAKLIDKLRVEHARTLLATSALALKTLARDAGFGSTAHMNRAFERELGMSPQDYRRLHAASAF
jgi:transcriptional regulator GlxA family with amidase domain